MKVFTGNFLKSHGDLFASVIYFFCDSLRKQYHIKYLIHCNICCVWDTTIALEAKACEYLVIARKKGDKWYIGAMTNFTERNLNIPIDFIDNKNYSMHILSDGMNANRHASDYMISNQTLKKVILLISKWRKAADG